MRRLWCTDVLQKYHQVLGLGVKTSDGDAIPLDLQIRHSIGDLECMGFGRGSIATGREILDHLPQIVRTRVEPPAGGFMQPERPASLKRTGLVLFFLGFPFGWEMKFHFLRAPVKLKLQ